MRSIDIPPAMAHHHHLHQHSSLHHYHQHTGPTPPHHQQNFHHPLQYHPPAPSHLLHQLVPPELLLPPQQHTPQQPLSQPPPPPPQAFTALPPPASTVDAPSASPSHYSLRWNNHQSHILAAFDALLQAETLVDVTLVCAETSVRAHKVVLSACSPFFQRIFSENPCKHPVIVLKDFNGWEVQAIVDFMYKGEISVGQEQLQDLIHAAESLQIRGLVSQDHIDLLDSKARANSLSPTPNRALTPTPSQPASPSLQQLQQQQQQQDFERNFYGGTPSSRYGTHQSLMFMRHDISSSPFSPIPRSQSHHQSSPSSVGCGGLTKLPHMPQLSFPGMDPTLPPPSVRTDCHSPIPRRKQARPRRRSGEMSLVCQNIPPHNNNNSISSNNNNPISIIPQDLTAIKQQCITPTVQQDEQEEVAENLSMKKSRDNEELDAPPPTSLPSQSPSINRDQTSSTSSSQQITTGESNSKRSTSPANVDISLEQEEHDEENCSPILPPPPTTPQSQSRLTPSSHATADGGPHLLTPEPSTSPELDLSMHHKDFIVRRSSSLSPGSRGPLQGHGHHTGPPPLPPLGLPPSMLSVLRHEMESHSPLHFPPMPSVSALTMTPSHIFGLDSPLGLFPPGLEGCRNPLLDMADHRPPNDPPMFVKKKMGRPKGQHSAPRGGPPRSWTNAELTEALQHVWNKKMTTSQASRIFGIPYNSLLMYVRGKYGKSLKLEQLRRDCIGGPMPLDHLMGMEGSGGGGKRGHNNNNMSGGKRPRSVSGGGEERRGPGTDHPDRIGNSPIQHSTRPSSVDVDHSNHPLFNPFGPGGGFYPDFGLPGGPSGGPPGGFPLPVSMMHLLPQGAGSGSGGSSGSDVKNRPDLPHHHPGGPPGPGNPFGGLPLPLPTHQMSLEEELSQHQQQLLQQAQQLAAVAAAAQHHQQSKGIKEEETHQDIFNAMAAREREERRELMVHQNGQD